MLLEGALELMGEKEELFIVASAVLLLYYILLTTSEWKLFTKAGEKSWKSLIPFYNLFVSHHLIGMSHIWFSLDIVFWAALTVTLIYLGWTVFCLYRFRLYFNGKRTFFLINAPLYGVLFAAAIITSGFDTEPYYTFLFMPFKLFHFAALSWSFPGAGYMNRPVSALLISILFAIPLVFIPEVITSKRKQKVKYIESHK